MAGKHVPKFCTHKASQRNYATDPRTGKPVYFGPAGSAGSPAAQRAYNAWLGKYLAAIGADIPNRPPRGETISVARLLLCYLEHARTYYLKHGQQTSEVSTLTQVVRVVGELFGTTDAAQFDASELKTVRRALLARDLARGYINKQIGRVRRIWRWAVEEELLPGSVLAGLEAVRDLQQGRTDAREEEDVLPVDPQALASTLFVADVRLCRMIRLQLLASMRPAEVCRMRGEDIDRTETPWAYTPWTHKTEHKGKDRVILFGPASREILEVALAERPSGWLFPSRGHPRQHLSVAGYWVALATLCERHQIPHWTPAQLRHSGLTEVRRRFGLEAAAGIGGHAHMSTSEIYALKSMELAKKVAEEMG